MLTVYRASAGAGKTYKLTGEYLMLLFSHPNAYRRILAVTFTNKATDEMKERIIEALYRMATNRSNDYIKELRDRYSITEEKVRAEAQRILIAILHDYSAFNISTIDRFFQQTMRAFTREIGLQGGYGVEMDQDLVLTESIDNLLGSLEKPENKVLLGWLLSFASDKIENGSHWGLRREIKNLSYEIFKESYKILSNDFGKELSDKNMLEAYKKTLLSIIRNVEDEAKRLGEEGMLLIHSFGLETSDFKRGQASVFEQLVKGNMKTPGSTFIDMSYAAENCCTKTLDPEIKARIYEAYDSGLGECFRRVVTLFEDLTTYNTAKEIIRYYYTLGILSDVAQQIAEYREEKNVMLIADTTELLNRIIDGSDVPFIYEKTGTVVDHYMIDEFQDTSAMQWKNFRPLIKESLASGRKNLIVGDIKQSIYRFRNSDWKLLDEQVQQDFRKEQLREDTLVENWRSAKNIVDFNNALFTTSPLLLQKMFNEAITGTYPEREIQESYASKIGRAYNKSYQQAAPPFLEKAGHVRIEFLEREQEDEEKTWKDEALEKLPSVLEQLQDNGYELKDIAILTRTNIEGSMAAEALLSYKEKHPSGKYKYDIISDEALFVSSSGAVRFLITMLKYIRNTSDKTMEAMAAFSYQICTGNLSEIKKTFPQKLKQELDELSHLSLYEITEGLYRLFASNFKENELAFVQAFLDLAANYARKEGTDIDRFLKWWEETGYRKAIATPDGQNAVRILTIHKSKGLGFKVVIMPFGDWEIDHKHTKSVILWCQPKVAPFNQLQLVPVRYGQILAQTIFAEDYFKEKLHAYIDNLNTLYVGFTRAKEELIVFAPRPKKFKKSSEETEKISSVSDLLWNGLLIVAEQTTEGESLISLPAHFNAENGLFEIGDWWKPGMKEDKRNQTEEVVVSQIFSVSPSDRLKLRLKGKSFFFSDHKRKQGILMHDVLSKIQTSADIPSVLEQYESSGVINTVEKADLIDQLTKLVTKSNIEEWFKEDGHILNEVDILYGNGHSRRPDRVIIKDNVVTVIDYKFGEKEDKRHHTQVRSYMKLIRDMGYKQIKGFLWYVQLDKIEEVFFDIS